MSLIATDTSKFMQYWKPKGVGQDMPSLTVRSTVLRIRGTDETLTIPVYVNTKVEEVRLVLATKLGLGSPDQLKFWHRSGSYVKENLKYEEIAREVIVLGIKNFERERAEWPHPFVVIGAGHLGLKFGLTWLMESPQYTNWVMFDRRPEIGGTFWWQHANKTSRLQTEVGMYHLQYHETGGKPPNSTANPWPSRDEIIQNMRTVAGDYGLEPYCRLNTEVKRLTVVGRDKWESHYEVTTVRDDEHDVLQASGVCLFPGTLTIPTRMAYKGEDVFDGDIVYGFGDECDYEKYKGKTVCIMGGGAFAVENVQTCVEFSVQKMFMVSRRKNLAMPRIVSWLINQSSEFISAPLALEAMAPMFDLVGVDHWHSYSVYADKTRTNVTIRQKSRFGIGDAYFLAVFFDMCEHIVSDIKRLSNNRVYLMNGKILDDIASVIKVLGFSGDFENDKLMKTKELYGWWVNRDMRRYVVAEPLGVDSNTFSTTGFSPCALMWAEQQIHLLHYYRDWAPVEQSNAMPISRADVANDKPAYVVEARHGSLVSAALASLVPALGARSLELGQLKRQKMLAAHPLDKFLEAAKREWDACVKRIQGQGYRKRVPDYPYSTEMVQAFLEKEKQELNELQAGMLKQAAGPGGAGAVTQLPEARSASSSPSAASRSAEEKRAAMRERVVKARREAA